MHSHRKTISDNTDITIRNPKTSNTSSLRNSHFLGGELGSMVMEQEEKQKQKLNGLLLPSLLLLLLLLLFYYYYYHYYYYYYYYKIIS